MSSRRYPPRFHPRVRKRKDLAWPLVVKQSTSPTRPKDSSEKEMRFMYQPNFCAECGVRLERLRVRPWTGGRFFCAVCGKRFRRGRFRVSLFLSAALFSVGFVAGRAGRPASPPLIIKGGATLIAAPPGRDDAIAALPSRQTVEAAESGTSAGKNSGPRYGADGAADERPTDPSEIVSMCGARTKKGTPCSRRVRGTGRCWQHRGLPAVLPPSKLIVRE